MPPAPLRLARAPGTILELPDGRRITVPPPSLDQCVECLRLDPDETAAGEAEAARLQRRQGQARALLGPAHAHLTAELGIEQVAEVTACLYAAACGYDPAAWQRLQAGLRAQAAARSSLELLAELDALCVDLAAELRRFPDEVSQRPLADLVSLRAQIGEKANADVRLQAALHGRG